jgi:catechol 2,3-dioxygenase-like lactoylglutathione lyase family enzyme
VTRRHGYKRVVRQRMASAGVSYSTARQQLHTRARADRTEVAVVVVPVGNMSDSVEFYTQVLGAEPLGAADDWTELNLGDLRIALSRHDGDPVDTGIALLVDDLEHVVASAHAYRGSASAQPSDTVAQLRDPDGNTLRVMQAAAES